MIHLPMAPLAPDEPMMGDEEQAALGFRHCHQQMNTLAQQVFATAAHVGALVEALHDRGLLDEDQLAERRASEEKRLEALFQERQVGVRISEHYPDKYAIQMDAVPEIDCESRYHLCRAACCALRFPLSRQDLDEGVVRWNLGQPYMIRQGRDGYCVHLDRGSRRCSVYGRRPGICRTYDCREDRRIWLDFEARLINPELFATTGDGQRPPQFPTRQVRISPDGTSEGPEAPAGAAPTPLREAQPGAGTVL